MSPSIGVVGPRAALKARRQDCRRPACKLGGNNRGARSRCRARGGFGAPPVPRELAAPGCVSIRVTLVGPPRAGGACAPRLLGHRVRPEFEGRPPSVLSPSPTLRPETQNRAASWVKGKL